MIHSRYLNVQRYILEVQTGRNTTEISGSYSIINIHSDKVLSIFGHQHTFGQVSKVRQV